MQTTDREGVTGPGTVAVLITRRTAEREAIAWLERPMLELSGGNRSDAASHLGISRRDSRGCRETDIRRGVSEELPMGERLSTLGAIILLIWAAGSCGENGATGPVTVAPGSLTILRQADPAPKLETYTASVWAVRGTSQTLEIDYVAPPDGEGKDLFRLDIPGNSLLNRPDGTPFQEGDSVLITVTIDFELLLMEFQPSGLMFSESHPARLRIDYGEADDDLNGDGVVDAADEELKDRRLALWRQERSGTRWVRLGSAHLQELEEFEGDLTRFSNYALGW